VFGIGRLAHFHLFDAQAVVFLRFLEPNFEFEFLLTVRAVFNFDLNWFTELEGNLPIVARDGEFGPRVDLVGEFVEEGCSQFA
jgi:hypothetical protein